VYRQEVFWTLPWRVPASWPSRRSPQVAAAAVAASPSSFICLLPEKEINGYQSTQALNSPLLRLSFFNQQFSVDQRMLLKSFCPLVKMATHSNGSLSHTFFSSKRAAGCRKASERAVKALNDDKEDV
jgi:hypothetical protein